MNKIDNHKYIHNLYWANIPGHQDHLNINSRWRPFNQITTPYILYTGNSSLVFEGLDLEQLRGQHIAVYLFEPLCLYTTGFNRGYYQEFKATDDLGGLRSIELDSLAQVSQDHDISFLVHTCDRGLDRLQANYPNLTIVCYDSFIRSLYFEDLYGRTAWYQRLWHKIVPPTPQWQHRFLAANWRYTLHRHLLAAYMVDLDCRLTWNYHCSDQLIINNDLVDLGPELTARLVLGNHRLNLYPRVLDQPRAEPLAVEHNWAHYIPSETNPHWTQEYLGAYRDSYCVVAAETRYFQPTANISEKTLLAVAALRPWIIVAPPGSVQLMRDLGFRTFDRWWDESYDSIEDHGLRLAKIFQLLDEINSWTPEQTLKIWREQRSTLEHNYRVLIRLRFDVKLLD